MAITFYPSQARGPRGKLPIAYTGHPLHLLWSDLCLIWRQKGRVGGILLPLRLYKLDEFDELYLTLEKHSCHRRSCLLSCCTTLLSAFAFYSSLGSGLGFHHLYHRLFYLQMGDLPSLSERWRELVGTHGQDERRS